MNRLMKLWIVLGTAGMLLLPALGYAQTSESAVRSTIGYFYSASGQMVDAEDNNGVMSSYLTRGERNDGTSETFAVSNIKDITADLDSNGNIINKYTYTAYGTQTSYPSTANIQNQTLSINVNPYTYDGYYTDSESGNYYLNARYYDPTLGIFFTSDSYNLPNRYMYVRGNPVMATDPLGHIEVGIEDLLKTHTVTAKFDGKTTEIKSQENWNSFAKSKNLTEFKFSFDSVSNVKDLDHASFSFQKSNNQYIHKERTETAHGKTTKATFDSSKKSYTVNNQLQIFIKHLKKDSNNANDEFHDHVSGNWELALGELNYDKEGLKKIIQESTLDEQKIICTSLLNKEFINGSKALYGEKKIIFNKNDLLLKKNQNLDLK